MASIKNILSVAAFAAAASAYTQPGAQTFGSLYLPDTTHPVTQGQTYQVTWAPGSASDTVSLVLCNGPSNNCQLQANAIVERVPANAGSYSWSVPCSLPAGTMNTNTGYGMLIIVDGTGQFQYSTQFSVLAGSSCSGAMTSSSTASTPSSWSSWASTTSANHASTTPSASGKPTTAPSSQTGWYGSSSTFNTTTMMTAAATTMSSAYTHSTSASASMTEMTMSASTSSSASASATSSPTPKPFVGAASSIAASFGTLLAAAGLALFAL